MIFQKAEHAMFGEPVGKEVAGGMHITVEILLKKDDRFIMLRRPKGIEGHSLPDSSRGMLYFCHDTMHYGEPMEQCIRRIVKNQAKVGVKSFTIPYIGSFVLRNPTNWAFIVHVLAHVNKMPKTSHEVTEVVSFTKENVPDDLAWWNKRNLEIFLRSL